MDPTPVTQAGIPAKLFASSTCFIAILVHLGSNRVNKHRFYLYFDAFGVEIVEKQLLYCYFDVNILNIVLFP